MSTVGRGSAEAAGSAGIAPGDLLGGRWRVAGVAGRLDGRSHGPVLVNALDERQRQRVRVLVGEPVAAEGRGFPDPMLPAPLGVEALDDRRVAVALAWWEGAPLALGRPVATRPELLAWTRRLIAAYALLERIHASGPGTRRGRAHGHLSLRSFWTASRAGGGRDDLVLVDLLVDAQPDPRFSPADADPTDPRTDIYALAAVFWSLATGSLPFGEGAEAEAGHRTGRLPDTDVLPAPLVDVLRTALQKQPHHRFASAGRARLAFEQALAELDGLPRDARRAPERLAVPPREAPAEPDPEGPPEIHEATLDPAPRREARPPRRHLRGRSTGTSLPTWSAGAVIALALAVAAFGWTALVAACLAAGMLTVAQ